MKNTKTFALVAIIVFGLILVGLALTGCAGKDDDCAVTGTCNVPDAGPMVADAASAGVCAAYEDVLRDGWVCTINDGRPFVAGGFDFNEGSTACIIRSSHFRCPAPLAEVMLEDLHFVCVVRLSYNSEAVIECWH